MAGLWRGFVLLHLIGKVVEMPSNREKKLIYSGSYLLAKGIHLGLIFLEWSMVFYSDLVQQHSKLKVTQATGL